MIYRFDRFQVDDVDFRLSADGIGVGLEPKALNVLLYLVRNRNRLVRKQEILDEIWQDANVTEAALTRSIGLLRKTLEDDSREPRFIQTVPTAGYRFIAEVLVFGGPVAAVAEPIPQQAGPKAKRWRPGIVAALAGAALLLPASGWLVQRRRNAAAPIRSLAVLPLENLSGDPTQEYFADGMTDELITELAHIRDLRVVSRTSVMQDKGTHKGLREIANELNVDAVVEGSIVRSGQTVRITAQLIDVRSDKHLWAESFEGQSDDLVALQDRVAREIASQARVVLVAETGQGAASRGVGAGAHDAYLRGRYFLGKGDVRRSTDYFQQAIVLDPTYASAYAGLADALEASTTLLNMRREDVMPGAIAAAKHAIELDSGNGEAYTALGSIETIYGWKWTDAERDLRRGIALSPSYSLAEMKYAVYLDAVGRADEAAAHMRRALDLDPLSFFMNRRLGATLYLARDYDGAIAVLQRAAEMEPSRHGVVDNYLSLIYEKKGMRDQAVDHDLTALHNNWHELDIEGLRSIYRRKGWEAYWRARIAALEPKEDQECVVYEAGVSYLRLGDKDRAFAALNRAVDRRCYRVIWIKVDPLMDSARDDSRYLRLLQRVNLAPP